MECYTKSPVFADRGDYFFRNNPIIAEISARTNTEKDIIKVNASNTLITLPSFLLCESERRAFTIIPVFSDCLTLLYYKRFEITNICS